MSSWRHVCGGLLLLAGCPQPETLPGSERQTPATRDPGPPTPPLEWSDFPPVSAPPQTLIEIALLSRPLPGGTTLADLERDTDPNRKPHPRVPIIFRAVDYGQATQPNGTLQVRGNTSRLNDQKSYAIKLDDAAPAWRGTHTILLNKHPYDLTRVRNKLSFDLFSSLPGMFGLKSAFVRLTLDGRDLGLFTQVEHVGPRYLREHGLGEGGSLYKAKFFEFLPLPALKLASDPGYDQAAFEAVLEIKEGKDHRRLLALIADVNDPALPINTIIARHFDRKAYITWLAASLLTRNLDTSSQNFFLAAGPGSDVWSFIPWDYDGAWGLYEQPNQRGYQLPRWRNGLANWWGTILHRRFLREPANLVQFTQAVDQLAAGFFTRDRIQALLDSYKHVVWPALAREPDLSRLPVTPAEAAAKMQAWQSEIDRLPSVVAMEQARYHDLLGRPMPFFLGTPSVTDGTAALHWDQAFDLSGGQVRYDLAVARTPDFAMLIHEQLGLAEPRATVDPPLPRGTYYWRVIARSQKDPATLWQEPFDQVLVGNNRYPGMASFAVP